MPVSYELERDAELLCTECTGPVSFEEVLGHFRELDADDSLPTRLDILLDLTTTESLPDADQLRTIASEVDRIRRKVEWGACAIVASRDALFGMARMFQVFSEDYFADSNVFRERKQAERWLESVRSRTR